MIIGDVMSAMVTLKLHVAPLLALSNAVQYTMAGVFNDVNVDPLAGAQV